MRSLEILTLVTLLALGAPLAMSRAEAASLPTRTAVGIAAGESSLRQDAAYVCRRTWRCGASGCGWRRACFWTPGPFAYAYPYTYRPYWRGYRHWGRPYWQGRRYWR